MSGGDPKAPAVTLRAPPRCGSCRSFRRNPKVIGQGACIWGPPQMVPVMHGGVPSLMSTRPTVGSEDACDQWSANDGD